MRVCVLQPDYADSTLAYRQFDPPRNLSALLPESTVDHLFLRKATVYAQLRAAAQKHYDIFVNLCEGYLQWDIPSLDVIWSLDLLKLPYTGPGTRHYDPSKALMKYVAHTQGVGFPAYIEATSLSDCDEALTRLRFPLFVKPAHAGDSLGIDHDSYVTSEAELRRKCSHVIAEFGTALVEEFIEGREFTVLVVANAHDRFRPAALAPIEFLFPDGEHFKTYYLKVEQHHPECNVPVTDGALGERLRLAAREVFQGFEGQGYARLDFRMNAAGELYFLDINFACSVFYQEGFEGSADYILRHDPGGPAGFLRRIIDEGIHRWRRGRRLYARRGNAVSGFGIYAIEDLSVGQVLFRGEEGTHRLVSRKHVERAWPARNRAIFDRYALPINQQIHILWSDDPEQWAPQNHSCEPNTVFSGLDMIALRPIRSGEELTLDYGTLCDSSMTPFQCACGSPKCRGTIQGEPLNHLGSE